MAFFMDTLGRRWEVQVNVTVARRVKSLAGVNLFQLAEDQSKPFWELAADPLRFVDVLYVVCQEEADKRQVTDEDFGRGFSEGVWEQAADALYEALADFFQPHRRKVMKTLHQKARKLEALAIHQGQDRLESLDDVDLLKQLGSLSGSVPASSASTPDPIPSENSSG